MSITSTQSRKVKVSREDYFEHYLPRGYEYVDGYAVPRFPEIQDDQDDNEKWQLAGPKLVHGLLIFRIVPRLLAYLERNDKRGEIFNNVAFTTHAKTGKIRVPDLAYLSTEQLAQKPDLYDAVPFPPAWALEVVSESDKADDVRVKAQEYIDNGTRLLWVIYPAVREIDVYRPGQAPQTLRPGDVLEGGEVLPGFELTLNDIFAVLD